MRCFEVMRMLALVQFADCLGQLVCAVKGRLRTIRNVRCLEMTHTCRGSATFELQCATLYSLFKRRHVEFVFCGRLRLGHWVLVLAICVRHSIPLHCFYTNGDVLC